ncbi:PadR family transcriptional regulator [candidate division KSB1 bacterium]
MNQLTLNEEILLLAIWKLKYNAYPVSIRDEVMKMTNRNLVYGTLYRSLDYVQKKGYVVSKRGEPTAERGGKGKLFFKLTDSGITALLKARELHQSIWDDINTVSLENSKAKS